MLLRCVGRSTGASGVTDVLATPPTWLESPFTLEVLVDMRRTPMGAFSRGYSPGFGVVAPGVGRGE